jgi:hypothetical protein
VHRKDVSRLLAVNLGKSFSVDMTHESRSGERERITKVTGPGGDTLLAAPGQPCIKATTQGDIIAELWKWPGLIASGNRLAKVNPDTTTNNTTTTPCTSPRHFALSNYTLH